MCVVHCPTNVFVVGNLNLLLVCHRTNYTCMHLPALLTSHHNLQLRVCCVLHILNFDQWCMFFDLHCFRREVIWDSHVHYNMCDQCSTNQYTILYIVMHVPLHCYRRVIISSGDREKAYSSWEFLLHQNWQQEGYGGFTGSGGISGDAYMHLSWIIECIHL